MRCSRTIMAYDTSRKLDRESQWSRRKASWSYTVFEQSPGGSFLIGDQKHALTHPLGLFGRSLTLNKRQDSKSSSQMYQSGNREPWTYRRSQTARDLTTLNAWPKAPTNNVGYIRPCPSSRRPEAFVRSTPPILPGTNQRPRHGHRITVDFFILEWHSGSRYDSSDGSNEGWAHHTICIRESQRW